MSKSPSTFFRQFSWVAFLVAVGGAVVFGMSIQEIFDSPDLDRWTREPGASDLPRIWFNGHVGPLSEPKRCFIRQEHHTGGKNKVWLVDKYLAPEPIPLESQGNHFSVSIADLDADGRTLLDSESLPYDPAIASDNLRFVEVCFAEGDHVTVDGCTNGEGGLMRCSPDELVGIHGHPGTLAEQRQARIRKASRAIWATLFAPFALLLFLWAYELGFPFAQRVRVRPSVRRQIRRNMVLGAAAALVAPAIALGARAYLPVIACAIVPALVVPFVYWRARAIRGLLHDLRDPPRGSVRVEGRVADDSPLGKRALADEPVALSLVEVHRETRGSKGEVTGYYAVGEVQDVGELRVLGTFGRATVPVDDAIVEIELDDEIVVPGSKVPPEIAGSVELDRDQPYRLREHCLKPGDEVTILVEGELQHAAEGDAYRSAPAGLNLAGGARPVIFEGTKDAVLRRFGRDARWLEALVVVFVAAGIGASAWAIVIARTLR